MFLGGECGSRGAKALHSSTACGRLCLGVKVGVAEEPAQALLSGMDEGPRV